MHRNPRLNRDGDFIFAGSVIVQLHGCVGGGDVGCEKRVCGKSARVRFSFSGSVIVCFISAYQTQQFRVPLLCKTGR